MVGMWPMGWSQHIFLEKKKQVYILSKWELQINTWLGVELAKQQTQSDMNNLDRSSYSVRYLLLRNYMYPGLDEKSSEGQSTLWRRFGCSHRAQVTAMHYVEDRKGRLDVTLRHSHARWEKHGWLWNDSADMNMKRGGWAHMQKKACSF